MSILAKNQINFDCASKGEIKQVLDLDINHNRIIYANPYKSDSDIKYAESKDVLIVHAAGNDAKDIDTENDLKKIDINVIIITQIIWFWGLLLKRLVPRNSHNLWPKIFLSHLE